MAKKETNSPAKKEKKEKQNKRSIGRFFKDVWGELKKVTWPTKKELVSYTLTVIGFIAIFAVIIGVLDFAFGNGLGLLAAL
ncbi:MAG: preprotein translocase subunit SecE [Clostridia bacterium]|nr:preprotein translocase subunit SecE [Clostridia bacterium]